MMSHPAGIGQMAALYSLAYRRRVRREMWKLGAIVLGEAVFTLCLVQFFAP